MNLSRVQILEDADFKSLLKTLRFLSAYLCIPGEWMARNELNRNEFVKNSLILLFISKASAEIIREMSRPIRLARIPIIPRRSRNNPEPASLAFKQGRCAPSIQPLWDFLRLSALVGHLLLPNSFALQLPYRISLYPDTHVIQTSHHLAIGKYGEHFCP